MSPASFASHGEGCGANFRLMSADDLKYAYAAHKMAIMDGMPRNAQPIEFNERFISGIEQMTEVYTLTIPNGEGRKPIGLVFTTLVDDPETTPHILPKTLWFPWATNRNRFEAFTKWLAEMRLETMILISAPRTQHKFYIALCRRGIMRPIGTIRGFLRGEVDENDAMLYQSVVKGK